MRFETVKAGDIDFAKEIWARSFGDEYEYIDYYFDNRVPPDHVFGLRDDSGLVSILCVIPMLFKVRDSLIRTAFISGVSTLPEKRGKGYISVLMSGIIPYLREMGFDLAFLSPAVEGMYEKYGFSYCTQKKLYAASHSDIIQRTTSNSYDISACSTAEIAEISSVYSNLVKGSSCIPARNVRDWEFILHDLVAERGGILLAKENDRPVGYLAWKHKNNSLESPESIFPAGKLFDVLADKAFKTSGLDTGNFTLSPNSKFRKISSVSDGMARIIDFPAMMQHMNDSQAENGEIILSIDDPLCEWNNGIFKINKREEVYSTERISKAPDVALPIGALTQWVCGSMIRAFEETVYAGNRNNPELDLAKILPKKNCICFDKY